MMGTHEQEEGGGGYLFAAHAPRKLAVIQAILSFISQHEPPTRFLQCPTRVAKVHPK